MEFETKKQLGLIQNKEMKINTIYGLRIDNFRKFNNQILKLGRNMTVIFGRNGTLKSTLMGLIAQPFRTKETNIFGEPMQTKFSEVFRMSPEFDNKTYQYHLRMNIDQDLKIEEPVPLYPEKNPETGKIARFRLVPSGRANGDGYFDLPSVYTKLDRIYPLIDSTLHEQPNKNPNLSEAEQKNIASFFESVLLRDDFQKNNLFESDHDSRQNYAYEPSDSYYDKSTISSGEDNLAKFINTMISFQRIFEKNHTPNNNNDVQPLTGVWNIDEFEASLHPIAQVNLFKYLLRWSRKYKVQIIINTHSLFLIQKVLTYQKEIANQNLVINEITSRFQKKDNLQIVENPTYDAAYTELTLSKYTDPNIIDKVSIKLFCEDAVAENYLKKILPNKAKTYISWQPDTDPDQAGTSYVLLNRLCTNYPNILRNENAIVILDADQASSIQKDVKTGKPKGYPKHYFIPSLYGFPIEKELVYWILSLNGNDEFFIKNDKSQEEFKREFKEFNIPLSITDARTMKIDSFKRWYQSDKRKNNTYLTKYIHVNSDLFCNFKQTIISDITELMSANGVKIDV